MFISVLGQRRFAILILFLSIVCVDGAEAQANKAAEVPANGKQGMQVPDSIHAEDYIIGPDDLLNVYVLDVPELSRDYRVSNSGNVTLPVLQKPLAASGLILPQHCIV